jgi:hypothetical protein
VTTRVWLLLISLLPVTAAPLQLDIVQGDGAVHNIRERQFIEPVVRVLDAGQPVEGAIVSFLLPQVGASGQFTEGPILTVRTSHDGVATARGFRPNSITGQFEIRVAASWNGRTARTSILQTNAAPTGGHRAKSRSRTYVIFSVIAGGAAAGAVAALHRSGSSAGTIAAPVTQLPTAAQPPATIIAGAASVGSPSP